MCFFFIQVMYLGTGIVKSHDGYGLAENLKSLLDDRGIVYKQVAGLSVDGQYIHLDVESALTSVYGVDTPTVNICWDPMHKAGLVDKHLNDNNDFDWLSGLVALCQDLYAKFNWGQSHELYIDAGKEIGEPTSNLTKFSETRFANSKRFVFISVLKNLKTIYKCLQDIQIENRGGSSRQKEKASEAASLEGRLMNATTLLRLCAAADVYQTYGCLVNICQEVNCLPHERLAKFDHNLEKINQMANVANDHQQCPGDCCKWRYFHAACESFLKQHEICGLPVPDLVPQRLGIGAHGTRRAARTTMHTSDEVESVTDLLKSVQEEAALLANKLADSLKMKVFPEEDRRNINETETITDLQAVYRMVQQEGPVMTSATQWPQTLVAIRKTVPNLANVADEQLEKQYITLCHTLASEPFTNIVKSIQDSNQRSGVEGSLSKRLIQEMLRSENAFYISTELIMHAVCVAALSYGVESVVESIVSVYEHRFSQTRNVHENTAEDEMEIKINGPFPTDSDPIIITALNKYFSKGKKSTAWHFLRESSLFSFCTDSSTLRRLKNKKSKFPFVL